MLGTTESAAAGRWRCCRWCCCRWCCCLCGCCRCRGCAATAVRRRWRRSVMARLLLLLLLLLRRTSAHLDSHACSACILDSMLVGSCSLARARCRVLLGHAHARWLLELAGESGCVVTVCKHMAVSTAQSRNEAAICVVHMKRGLSRRRMRTTTINGREEARPSSSGSCSMAAHVAIPASHTRAQQFQRAQSTRA